MYRQKRQREESNYQAELLEKYNRWNEAFTEIICLLKIDQLFGTQKNDITSYSNATIALCEAIFNAQEKGEIKYDLINAHWKTFSSAPLKDEDFLRIRFWISVLISKAKELAIYYTSVFEERKAEEIENSVHSEFTSSILEMFMVAMPFIVKTETLCLPEFSTKKLSWELISEVSKKKPLVLCTLFEKITQSSDPITIFHNALVSDEDNLDIQMFCFIKKIVAPPSLSLLSLAHQARSIVTATTPPQPITTYIPTAQRPSVFTVQTSSTAPDSFYDELVNKLGENKVLYALYKKSIERLVSDRGVVRELQKKSMNIQSSNIEILITCDPEYKTGVDRNGNVIETLHLDKAKMAMYDSSGTLDKAIRRKPKESRPRFYFVREVSSDININQTKIIYRLMEPSN